MAALFLKAERTEGVAMRGIEDPGIWKQVSGWLWALLLPFVGVLWKKADNAASKDDLKNAVEAIGKSIDKHIEDDKETRIEIRDTQKSIFTRLDQQDKLLASVDTTVRLTREELMRK